MIGWLWNLLATWCLTYEGGKPVVSGMWLTEGDDWRLLLDLHRPLLGDDR